MRREKRSGNFEESLDWSRRQETVAWELRTATSLAKMHHGQGAER